MGTIKDFKAKLVVQEVAQPRFHRPRPVAFALKEGVNQELDRLEANGILKRVDFSQWAARIVVVPKKDGGLRLCGDYKLTVNPTLDIDVHPLPKPEEIFTALVGGKRFTKIDLCNAYQQMVLEDPSKEFLTINTHKGLYQYTRLPFGMSSAPAIFQRTMDSILAGIPHVACYIDDIIVTGTTNQSIGTIVLSRLKSYGIKAKKEKCLFFSKSVQYLGYIISSSGLHTVPSKMEAILNAPRPTNVQELRSFLGFINYYRKFIPNLSSILTPLNALLQKGVRWEWTETCSTAIKEAKMRLQAAPILMHYDPFSVGD